MARPLRIEIPGGLYHVITHGNGRLWLFRDDRDCEQFLKLLGACVYKFGVVIHAFVLMTTHLHLLVETPVPNLSRFMRRLLSDYGLYYNKRYRRRGSVFKSRYGSFLIQKDNYYLMVVRYLYDNPVRAGAAKQATLYRWSSLNYLLHKHRLKRIPWYRGDEILQLVGGRRGLADLMTGGAEELPRVYRVFIGDKAWADDMIEAQYGRINDEISGGREMRKGVVDSELVLALVARAYKTTVRMLMSGRHRAARQLSVYYLYRYTSLGARDVGTLFGMSRWAVAQLVHRMEQSGLNKKSQRILQTIQKRMSHVMT